MMMSTEPPSHSSAARPLVQQRPGRWPRAAAITLGVVALLLCPAPSQAAVVINEFLANNGGGLQDEDLQSPDWIELLNTGPSAVNLGGWYLTDDAANLTKWEFPATNLPAGGFMVVFASEKDRAVAGRPLHVNFQLDNDGEYLALVQPGGTIAHAYSPAYPNQRQNVSYGVEIPTLTTSLIASGAASRVWVPGSDALGVTWTEAGFSDASWTSMNTPAAFSVGVTASTVLAIDVNDRSSNTAGLTEPGFSAFVINSVGSSTAIQTQPTVRVYGGITITLSNTTSAGYDDRLRTSPGNSGAFTESLLLRDNLFSQDNSGTGGLDIGISGLTPNIAHRVTLWSFDGQSFGAKVSDWFANGVLVKSNYTFNSNVSPSSNDQYQFSFDATTSGSGSMLISGRRDPSTTSFGAYLNALKIERLTAQTATNAFGALMLSNNATAYIRIPFNVSDPAAFETLKLRMRYDDGFVAYLNGQLVAARNAPASPQWNSTATSAAPDSLSLVGEEILIPNSPGLLQAGGNVLAIQGLNVSSTDTDFYISAELEGLATGTPVERYFTPSTPGAINEAGYLGLVSDTKFSVDRGFYSVPFSVAITSATASASIYWTTNGSVPTPTNGTLYSGPILIPGTRLLRAAAFLADHVPSIPDTHSYIFLDQVLNQSSNQPGYPTVWQANYPADYGMDPEVVNSAKYGGTISNDLRAIPTLSLVSSHDAFWSSSEGIYPNATLVREVPTSVELFDGDNKSGFQINASIQMHGQAGRDNVRSAKHSFRIEFKADYGPSQLDYDWFGGGVKEFDTIVLQTTWADSWTTRYDPFSGVTPPYTDTDPLRYRPENATYLRDIWVRQAMQDMGHLASRSSPVHLYVNGLYWGIYHPSERYDTAYFVNNLGGYKKDWDVLKDRQDLSGGLWKAELQDGTDQDWTNLIVFVNAGIDSEADFQAVAAQVDIDNLIDYMLLHALVEANDWLQDSNPHNWYAAHRRANPTNGLPATKWIFLPWDQEISFNRLRTEDRVNVSADQMPSRIYSKLREWPEFRRMYGDRVQKHLFNGGALSPTNNILRLQALAQRIERAIVAESARWGDARKFDIGSNVGTGQTLTRDETWVPELQALMTNWYPNVMNQRVITRLQAAGLYPTLQAPEFNQFGGAVSNGFALTLSHSNASGLVYFTVDGSDPRQYGSGAIAIGAQHYEDPILINAPTVVRARTYSSQNWSALVEAVFYPPQDFSKLALTEIMYNPPAMGDMPGSNLEFIELKNTGTNALNLSGLSFTSGIAFTFTNGAVLEPGHFVVLARNADAFAAKYPGVTVDGTYTGQLDNSGEKITLSHALGTPILSVTYDDRPEWPVVPDLADFSLVQTAPGISQAPDRGYRWRASTNPGGSPGADDPAPIMAPIAISEILAHTDLPQTDTIELLNPTGTNVDIGGWFLSDEPEVPAKFRIPDHTIIPAGGRIAFDEQDFNSPPDSSNSFRLSSVGDDVYLFSADTNGNLTGYSHGAVFGASFNGVSFGLNVNSAGEEFYSIEKALTLGTENAGPAIGPVVISEIQYHPEPGGDEFVELFNLTSEPVNLFHAAFPTNAWKLGGLGFTFPTNVVLDANSTLLVVATNPAGFRAKYAVPTNILILGPYTGQLQDSGENIELLVPDTPNTNGVPYVAIDAVRYNDRSPWPIGADGGGLSLQRAPVAGYGNEPANWIAGVPTPGSIAITGDSDSDGDGLPDGWESEHGTLVFVSDADDDPDHDGLTNRQEYLAGTHPNDPASRLMLASLMTENGDVTIQFLASSNRTYSVFFKDSFLEPLWSKLTDIPAQPTNHWVILTNSVPDRAERFFRLVTPAQAQEPAASGLRIGP